MNRSERLKFNRRNIAEFRSSGGRIASFGDSTMLLLTTTGASSGLSRTAPLAYLADEHDPNRVYVFGSAAGQDQNPAWFRNLVAKPDDLVVEIGTDRLTAEAEVVQEPRRSEIYERQAARSSSFAAYQEKTARRIPVVALTLHRNPPA